MKRNITSLLMVLLPLMLLTSCEVVDPEGDITFDNYNNCSFNCYFDGDYLGTVSAYGTRTFTVKAECGYAEIKSATCADDELYVCISEGETEVVNIY